VVHVQGEKGGKYNYAEMLKKKKRGTAKRRIEKKKVIMILWF